MMRRLFLFAFLVVLGGLFAPRAHAQSTFVMSSLTLENGFVIGECSTQPDGPTASLYGITSVCAMAENGSQLNSWSCSGRDALDCSSSLFNLFFANNPGATYTMTGRHFLNLPPDSIVVGTFDDPLDYIDNTLIPESCGASCTVNAADEIDRAFLQISQILLAGTETSLTTVTITPDSVTLGPGQSATFTSNLGTSWSSPGPGSVSQGGVYTAPTPITANQTTQVTVCSADGVSCAQATVNLIPISISINPTTLTLNQGQSFAFVADITGAKFTDVAWELTPPSPGGGSFTASTTAPAEAIYAAPSNFSTEQTVTLTAKSNTDPTKTASATITLSPVTVTINPAGPFVAVPGLAQTISATVTNSVGSTGSVAWTLSPPNAGSIASSGPTTASYTGPSSPVLTSPTSATVTACVTTNPGINPATIICATPLTLQLIPPVVVSGFAGSLIAGQSGQFTINGSGFGTAPTVALSDPSITFSVTSAGTSSISGTISVPTLAPPEAVTFTVTNSTDGIVPAPTGSGATVVSPVQLTTALSPGMVNLDEGQQSAFTATVTCKTAGQLGCTVPQTVNWSLTANLGSVSSAGVYTAPASITAQTSLQVKACPSINPGGSPCGFATINLNPIIVTVAPLTAALDGGQTNKFTANVSGIPPGGNLGVTWSLLPAGSPGSIDQTGLYTAPNPVITPQTISVQACSQTDTTRCGTATVVLTPPNVAVSPGTVSLSAGQTQQFSTVVTGIPNGGSVTWSLLPQLGTISASGLYTAPSPSVIGQQTVKATACSTTQMSVCGTAVITLLATQDFVTSAAPSSVTLASTGGTATYNLETQYINGGSATLTYTIGGLPAGVTGSIANSVLTVTVPSGTATGDYPFTVTVTGGTTTHKLNLDFSVVAAADFMLSAQKGSSGELVQPQAAAGYPLSISPVSGFTGTVALTVTGLPAGVTANFTPSSIAGGTGGSWLIVTTSSTTPAGVFTLTVTATSGAIAHTQNLALLVDAAADYSVLLSGTPPTQISQSGNWGFAVGNVKDLFSGLVQYSVSGLPAGMTSSMTNASVAGATLGTVSTLTLTVGSAVANGTYSITVNATSGTITHSTVISVQVATFTLAPTGSSSGQSGFVFNYSVPAKPGYTGTINLTSTGAPAGAMVSFSPASVPGNGTFTATVSFANTVPPGNYTITFNASDGTNTASSTQQFIILTSPDFTVPAIASATTTAGSAATFSVSVTGSGGFAGSVSFSASGLPAGATASFNPTSVKGSGSTTMTVSTASSTPTGTFTLTVTASGGGSSHSQTTSLVVNAPAPPPVQPRGGGGCGAAGTIGQGCAQVNPAP